MHAALFRKKCESSLVFHISFFNQAHGQPSQSSGVQYDPETLEEQNQVQSLPADHHQRRWAHSQHRSVGVLPQPEPEEETKPFILDLKNFPDLANADMGSQNPNIQVSGMSLYFMHSVSQSAVRNIGYRRCLGCNSNIYDILTGPFGSICTL